MTESQINDAAASATSLWDIGSELEGIHAQFNQVRNMLSVYSERIEDDIAYIGESKDGYALYFVSRYDALRSVMEVSQTKLFAAIEDLTAQIDAIYKEYRKRRMER